MTVAQLEDELGYDEWREWLAYFSLYDLPDGYLVASRLGPPLSGLAGVKSTPADFSAFYDLPSPTTSGDAAPASVQTSLASLGAAVAFVKAYAKQP